MVVPFLLPDFHISISSLEVLLDYFQILLEMDIDSRPVPYVLMRLVLAVFIVTGIFGTGRVVGVGFG